MSKWIAFTNEKLYLANRQWVIGQTFKEKADQVACHQSMILLLRQAYVGILNELAETRRLRTSVQSLDELSELSGFDSEWIVQLRHLATTPGSWLFELECELAKVQAPASRKEGDASYGENVALTNVIVTSVPSVDWPFLLGQMSAFAAQLREFNYQY